MIKLIQQLFSDRSADTEQATDDNALHLATAALLTEIIIADATITVEEETKLHDLLEHEFNIPSDLLDEIALEAKSRVDQSTDLYQYTQLINEHCSYEEKCHITFGLWQIAYADNELDKYEEHMIRKICELIYVDHTDFIRMKIKARDLH